MILYAFKMFCNHHFYFQYLPLSQIDSCRLGSNSPPLIRGLWWRLLLSLCLSISHLSRVILKYFPLYIWLFHIECFQGSSTLLQVLNFSFFVFFVFFLGQNNTLSWVYVTFCSFDKQLSYVYFSLWWSHYWGSQTLSVSSAFRNLLGHTVTSLCRSHWKCFLC